MAALADFIVLTVDHILFTRPYQPGHAKLKTRWPLYLLGAYGFAYGLANLELLVWNEPRSVAVLLASAAAVVAVFEWAVRRAGRDWRMEIGDTSGEDSSTITVLHLGTAPASARSG